MTTGDQICENCGTWLNICQGQCKPNENNRCPCGCPGPIRLSFPPLVTGWGLEGIEMNCQVSNAELAEERRENSRRLNKVSKPDPPVEIDRVTMEGIDPDDGDPYNKALFAPPNHDGSCCGGQPTFTFPSIDFPVFKGLSFESYQEQAMENSQYGRGQSVWYPALSLAGEAGEVANKVKKWCRGDYNLEDEGRKDAIAKEIGGVLWYCAALARDLGIPLSQIAQDNLDLVKDRNERGVIKGDGDDR